MVFPALTRLACQEFIPMASRTNRRQFLQTTAATGIGFWVAGGVRAKESRSPNERIAMASIGLGDKGAEDSTDAGNAGDMVAICDVDATFLNSAAKRWPKAKKYFDYRKLLEEMEKSIDAVTVSTPDHSHAPAAALAMRMKKHAFVQKPLTHSIYEARLLGELARENKVATQMGNQGTAMSSLRKAAALLHAGVVGKPKEVHVWSNRPIWPQGGPRPKAEPAPKTLKWDLWIGPAPLRPYGKGYHPSSWRGWWDFGCGALGDMACHTMNMPYMGLDLQNPTSVVATTSGHNRDSYPKWSVITWEFPARGDRPPVKLVWYDGGKRPPEGLLEGRKASGSGACIVGDKGKLYAPGDYAECDPIFLGGAHDLKVEYPVSPGHFKEWVNAIRGGPPARSNFPDYAGPLTEVILLGNLAVWAADKGEGKKIAWDAKNLKTLNAPEVEPIVRPAYRTGYAL
jgi:predicted dehydrogenase